MSGRKSFVRWLAVTALVAAGGVVGGSALRQVLSPFGIAMAPLDGSQAVDPRSAITIEPLGLGTRLVDVAVRDGNGTSLEGSFSPKKFTLAAPLEFGTRYQIVATVERPWTGQRLTRELALTTVHRPVLEGSLDRTMESDGSITLRFDRPIGPIQVTGPATLSMEPDADGRSVRLVLSGYPQGETLPLQVAWSTTTGVPLPAVQLAVATPPALTAEISPHDIKGVGLAMPIEISFSEPLASREQMGRSFSVQTGDGVALAGRWSWFGRQRVQFHPQPAWPASATIQVRIDRQTLRSARGGTLASPVAAQFSTGPDRRIVVYLDSQRMAAVENGEVVKTFKVSTGKAKTPTVSGSFYIYARFPTKTMRSRAKPGQPGHYVVENVPYAQYFHADYAFHGAWWHNAFGSPASHGCVNMSTRKNNKRWPGASEDAGWLYQWATLGVPVTVLRNTPSQQVALK